MDDSILHERAEAARGKLTADEYHAVVQVARNAVTPLVYEQGLIDGAAAALAKHARDRKSREVREARQRGEHLTPHVYFITSGTAIKIGTSRHPARRLAVMQTGHPGKLELLATCEGDAKVERAYHQRFAVFRQGGEWFAPAPEILAEIARLNEQESA